MDLATEVDLVESLDEPVTGGDSDPIGVTFASGIHERDLVSYLSRMQRLAGEVC
jgi:hypothetical protein